MTVFKGWEARKGKFTMAVKLEDTKKLVNEAVVKAAECIELVLDRYLLASHWETYEFSLRFSGGEIKVYCFSPSTAETASIRMENGEWSLWFIQNVLVYLSKKYVSVGRQVSMSDMDTARSSENDAVFQVLISRPD
jgi:hypothetical protein